MPYTVVDKGSKYFEAKTYTGTGATQSISNLSFSPDLVWIKSRSNASYHSLDDSVRGAGKTLFSNTTDAETTYTDAITSFNSDGWTMGTDASGGSVNVSGRTYVGWAWDANGTGVSNTSGTISSTVSANTTSGFSIVGYTGNGSSSATVGHGLGVTPAMIILKARAGTNANNSWFIYHKNLSANTTLNFNTFGERGTGTFSSGIINTSPTSSTFGFTAGSTVVNVNESGTTFVAYCFAEVKGYSKFGRYNGTGAVDGTFVHTGFKPAFVAIKRSDGTGNWIMFDNKRPNYNVIPFGLFPNSSTSENNDVQYYGFDLLSNGFKIRNTVAYGGEYNDPGLHIYMAFAESPFVSSKGIPTTAR
jgi:hypothetical protein